MFPKEFHWFIFTFMKVVRQVGLSYRELISKDQSEKYSFSATLDETTNHHIHLEKLPPKRRASAPHFHENLDESILVLKGTVFAVEGNEILQIREGDFVKFNRGGPQNHYIENRSDTEALFLVIKIHKS